MKKTQSTLARNKKSQQGKKENLEVTKTNGKTIHSFIAHVLKLKRKAAKLIYDYIND